MKFLFRVFRIKEWFNSKLTMQIGIFLMLAFCCGLDPISLLKPFFLFIAYAITYFALGYIANDLSDIKSDKRVGKRNAFQDVGIGVGITLFVILSILNIGIALIVSRNWIYILIIVFGYLLGIFYSFKPLRFKERGVLGLIVASLCQRNLQLAIVPFLFNVNIVLFALMNVLSFINGIRYILIHQYIDYDNDIKSGTTTFAINKRDLTKKIIIVCFAFELALTLGCFVYALGFDSYLLFLIPIAVLLLECSLYLMILKSKQSLFTSYGYVPLDLFYLVGIPVTFSVLIGVQSFKTCWGCLIVAIFLIIPIYSMFKVYFGYLKFFINNRHFIHGCRCLWKLTNTISELYFINVNPVFANAEEKDYAHELQSYAIISTCNVSVPFSILKPYLQGNTCRELVFNPSINSFEQPMNYFQLKNKSMLHYFAIYIIPKDIFWMNRKKSAAKTIVNCMAHSGEDRESFTVNEVECSVKQPNKDFYTFSGLACSELYFRRKDCFMSVFPSFLIFAIFWLIAGVIGIFLYKLLAIFAGGSIVLFCFAVLIDKFISIRKQGIINSFIFNKNLYSCKYSGKRVPLFKKYGIYTNSIVTAANHQRNKLIYAICAMLISLIAICCLALMGVII